ncbi:Uncharacterised protein [Achromobacter sp. 2789STDY5608615]|nr:Uncharacterised protein [Achromobacter sp. 2789STDY5608615]
MVPATTPLSVRSFEPRWVSVLPAPMKTSLASVTAAELSSAPEPLMLNEPLPSAVLLPTDTVPAASVTPPMALLLPPSARVPAPSLVTRPAPVRAWFSVKTLPASAMSKPAPAPTSMARLVPV